MVADAKISVLKKGYLKEAALAACVELQGKNLCFRIDESEDGKYMDVMMTVLSGDKSEPAVRGLIEKFGKILDEKQIQIKLIKNNMDACEQITYNALSNPVFFEEGAKEDKIPDSIAKILEDSSDDNDESYLDDPLNIATPWEEKSN